MTDQMTFGQWLRQCRRERDLTQNALGRSVGCSQITIRKIEADELRPSRQLSELLIDKLGVQPEKHEVFIHFARSGFYPVSVSAVSPHNNLPHWLTSFIGREHELAQIKHFLYTSRLVTLTGAGGCGKTRLAVQTATTVLAQYPDGTWFIELASINNSDTVPQIVAAALGLLRTGDVSYHFVLANFLKDQRGLLILDNCEHVLEACVSLVDILLKLCPKVTILATSREMLGITGEKVYRVPSLTALNPAATTDFHELEKSDSVRLFAERASAIQPGFSLSGETLPTVARICHRLDGIPLAIELAAARMSLLNVEEIADRLDDRFRLLTGGNRSALPRQRTLRASIDWSYSLLLDTERVLLQRLSIFSGGWSLEAAEAVCVGGGLVQGTILETLTLLVNKSLVWANPLTGKKSRYGMLETIRQYALEKLEQGDESKSIRCRHLDFYLKWTQENGPLLKTARIVETLERLDPDLDNLRTALAWGLNKGQSQGAEKALRILISLDYFWSLRALYWEMFPHFLNALEVFAPETSDGVELRAWGFYVLSTLQTDFNIEAETIQYLSQSIALFRRIGNQERLALALALRSYMNFRHHHFFPPSPTMSSEDAQHDQDESFIIARSLSQIPGSEYQRVIAWVDCWNGAGEVFRSDPLKARALGMKLQEVFHNLGDSIGEQYGLLEWLIASLALGDREKLFPYIDHAIGLAQHIGHKRYLSFFIHQKVVLLFALERYKEMETFALQGLLLQRQLGSPLGEVENYQFLGFASTHLRNYSQAAAYLRAGLHVSTQRMNYKDPYNLLVILIGFAGLAIENQHDTRAVKLMGFIEVQLRNYSKELLGQIKREFVRHKEKAQEALIGSDFQSFWQEGQAMSMDQAVACAREE